MKEEKAIEFLENLERGMFFTLNIPLTRNENIPITVMYVGKDKDGRYKFLDNGKIIMSKRFIKEKGIEIDKEYNEKDAIEIYAKMKRNRSKKDYRSR